MCVLISQVVSEFITFLNGLHIVKMTTFVGWSYIYFKEQSLQLKCFDGIYTYASRFAVYRYFVRWSPYGLSWQSN
jgi:hypothetical protein